MTTEDLAARGDFVARVRLRDKQYQTRLKRMLPVALLLAALFWTFDVDYIPSRSMEPGLKSGDHILTVRNWAAFSFRSVPNRGDVIIFRLPKKQLDLMHENDGTAAAMSDDPPDNGWLAYIERLRSNILIKRVVGLPGDSVLVTDNQVFINGKPLHEDYSIIPVGDEGGDFAFAADDPYKVPPGNVFVLGDNRNVSEDSRFWGPLPCNAILGKYVGTLYHQTIKEPADLSGGSEP